MFEKDINNKFVTLIDNIKQTYLAAVEQSNDWGEKDSIGNPINFEYVRKNYSLSINVYEDKNGEVSIRLFGYVSNENGELHLGDISLVTEIDCSTGEITYDLWE